MLCSRTLRTTLVIALLSWLIPGCADDESPTSPAENGPILVKPDGTGEYPTIQAAIDAADSSDVIELADGRFTGGGNRDIDFQGKAITVRSRSGNPDSCIVDCEGSEADPHYGFWFTGEETRASVLEGLTVENGYSFAGGGLLCGDASPSILRCHFSRNSGVLGGAIRCVQASPLISNCKFDANAATVGGAISCQYGSPFILDCEFTGNSATEKGGGVASEHGAPTISGTTFFGNSAGEVGGGIRCFYDSATLSDNTVTGNSAGMGGGGVSLEDVEETTTLLRCTVSENSAEAGAGIHCAGDVSISQCTIADNSATLCCGGLMLLGSSMTVSACTIAGNSAPSYGGGVLLGGEGALSMDRTIIAFSHGAEAFAIGENETVTLTCCDLYGNEGGDWVGRIADQFGANGNISEDPLFCDPESGDYSLQSSSPCSSASCGLIGAWPAQCE